MGDKDPLDPQMCFLSATTPHPAPAASRGDFSGDAGLLALSSLPPDATCRCMQNRGIASTAAPPERLRNPSEVIKPSGDGSNPTNFIKEEIKIGRARRCREHPGGISVTLAGPRVR